jgi:hypothetical protein
MKFPMPDWATISEIANSRGLQIVHVDVQKAYPSWLAELGVEEPDQYWLEVVYQCIKLDVQAAMLPHPVEIRMHDRGKVWAQSKYPEGRGAHIASPGGKMHGVKEEDTARGHYKRLRGFVPYT